MVICGLFTALLCWPKECIQFAYEFGVGGETLARLGQDNI